MFTRQLQQQNHHAMILFLVIFFGFVTCEALALSLSGSGSLSPIRSLGVMKLESSKYNTQIQGSTFFSRIQNSKTGCSQRCRRRQQQQHQNQYTPLYMTTEDDSNKNGDHADDKDLSSSNNAPFFEEPNEQSKKAMSDEQNKKRNTTMTVILTIPLFIKFFAVLCIKFLTDAVVFPSLFLYRLLRKTKRKIISLFQQGPGSIKPNGATPVEKQ
jgi:predicted nucleic acid-binding Zn ribbon protein